mgnify:CR=1 FL=1
MSEPHTWRLVVLSYVQVEPLLRARQAGKPSAMTSPDLGLTTVEVALLPEGVLFPGGERLSWQRLEEIDESRTKCFLVEDGHARPIEMFSEQMNRVYTLMPTERAPTLLLSGIPMHRIKGIDPYTDTFLKMRAIAPVIGRVLDTATGLGYTAIEAAKTAEQVITIEIDPAVLDVARLNPWSQALFDNPTIIQRIGNSFDVVQEFEDNSFARIIHDPPMFSLAGELYSLAFYRQLYRVLRPGGRLLHYVGNLERKSGRGIARGVALRLQEAGFARVTKRPEAFSLVAIK